MAATNETTPEAIKVISTSTEPSDLLDISPIATPSEATNETTPEAIKVISTSTEPSDLLDISPIATPSEPKKVIFLVGATGAQGLPIVNSLIAPAADGTPSPYSVRALTRNPEHRRAKDLADLGVEIVKGDLMDFPTIKEYLKGVYGMYVNTDFFTLGDEGETYGGIRLYEFAKYAGVRHFVWSNLDYASKKGGWKEEYACDHHDAKGRVGDYLSAQSNDIKDPKATLWTSLTTMAYMDMLNVQFSPLNVREDGTVVFAAPIGNGHAPLVALKDIAFWVRHIFDDPETTTGKDLEIASDVFDWETLVATFTKVTGKKAVFKRLTMDEFFDCFENADLTAATHAARPAASWRKTIGGLWAMFRDDILTRDMDWIRSVHPNTVSLEDWMRENQYDGSFSPLLKLIEDSNMSMYPNREKCAQL